MDSRDFHITTGQVFDVRSDATILLRTALGIVVPAARRLVREGYSCGQRKQCCEHCAYLDGTTGIQALMISVLRGTDGMSAGELCAEIDGRDPSGMLRTLHTLMDAKRIRRYWREGDAVKRKAFRGKVQNAGNAGYWVYRLSGR